MSFTNTCLGVPPSLRRVFSESSLRRTPQSRLILGFPDTSTGTPDRGVLVSLGLLVLTRDDPVPHPSTNPSVLISTNFSFLKEKLSPQSLPPETPHVASPLRSEGTSTYPSTLPTHYDLLVPGFLHVPRTSYDTPLKLPVSNHYLLGPTGHSFGPTPCVSAVDDVIAPSLSTLVWTGTSPLRIGSGSPLRVGSGCLHRVRLQGTNPDQHPWCEKGWSLWTCRVSYAPTSDATFCEVTQGRTGSEDK